MDKFRAFRVHRENNKVFGRVENLNISDLSKGEVVIKASYSSVNYKDALASTGAGKIIRNFPRQALHSSQLEFNDLGSNKSLSYCAPIPDDIENLIKQIKKEYLNT